MAPEIRQRILRERAAGHKLAEIAGDLEACGCPTRNRGSQWQPGTIAAVVGRALDTLSPSELARELGLQHGSRTWTKHCNPAMTRVQRFTRRQPGHHPERVAMVRCGDCGNAVTIQDPRH